MEMIITSQMGSTFLPSPAGVQDSAARRVPDRQLFHDDETDVNDTQDYRHQMGLYLSNGLKMYILHPGLKDSPDRRVFDRWLLHDPRPQELPAAPATYLRVRVHVQAGAQLYCRSRGRAGNTLRRR